MLEGIRLNTESAECRVQLVHVDEAAFVLVDSVEGGVQLVICFGSIENVLYSSSNMALSICVLGFRSIERWALGGTISELYDRTPSLSSSGAAGAHYVEGMWSQAEPKYSSSLQPRAPQRGDKSQKSYWTVL
jgi:hypothetical protein